MSNEPAQSRSWGFRFSLTDAMTLLVLAAATAVLYHNGSALWWLVVLVGGHFFLFCNVFRVDRKRELVWAALLLANVTFWIFLDRMDWVHVVPCQVPVSILAVVSEIRSKGYHGILADRINPKLDHFVDRNIP